MSCLPLETRAHLAAGHVSAVLSSEAGRAGSMAGRKLALMERIESKARSATQERALARAVKLDARATARMDAKLALIVAFEHYAEAAHAPLTRALHSFCVKYEGGSIDIAPEVQSEIPNVAPATLYRWQQALRRDGITSLAGNYGNRKGASAIETQEALHDFLVSMLVDHPHASSKHLVKAMSARFKGRPDIHMPSARSLQRWMKTWKRENAQVFEAVRNPDAYKSRFMTAMGKASEGVERLNQRWELDSTPGDVMLTDGRHTVIGAIDVYSRRARLFVSKTSKATAVATLIRHALLDWGVPEEMKTDNGSDYTSNHVKRVIEGLGVDQQLCPPFQPWRKPHIERFFRTFSHDLVELLGGFIGHNVADRKAIEERSAFSERLFQKDGVLEVSLTAAEFQKFCDDWAGNLYEHQAHEGLSGRSPFEVTSAWTGEVRRIEDERALDILLADAPANNGLRTIQKKGIELDGTHFIAPDLGPRVGEQVRVRLDPVDLGRIFVFDLAGEFVCVAEAPERTGVDRREVAIKGQSMQRAIVQDARRALKAKAKQLKTADIVNEILTDKAEAAGKLARLPVAAKPHTTPALAQAGAAFRATRQPGRTISEADIAAAKRSAFARDPEHAKVVHAIPETARQRWDRWERLSHIQALGGVIESQKDRDFLELYPESAEYKTQRRLQLQRPGTEANAN